MFWTGLYHFPKITVHFERRGIFVIALLGGRIQDSPLRDNALLKMENGITNGKYETLTLPSQSRIQDPEPEIGNS